MILQFSYFFLFLFWSILTAGNVNDFHLTITKQSIESREAKLLLDLEELDVKGQSCVFGDEAFIQNKK